MPRGGAFVRAWLCMRRERAFVGPRREPLRLVVECDHRKPADELARAQCGPVPLASGVRHWRAQVKARSESSEHAPCMPGSLCVWRERGGVRGVGGGKGVGSGAYGDALRCRPLLQAM